MAMMAVLLSGCDPSGDADVEICEPGTARAEEQQKALGMVGLGRRKVCLPCEPGEYCAGGTQKRIKCDGAKTADHDQDPRTPCVEQPICEAGTHLTEIGNATTARVCDVCAAGTWDHDQDPRTPCARWTDCPVGWHVIDPNEPGPLSDLRCDRCSDDTFTHAPMQAVCNQRKRCVPGQYAPRPVRADIDRECALCPAGTASTTKNATTCGPVAGIAASSTQTCARMATKTVRCWGSAVDANDAPVARLVATVVPDLEDVDQVAAGRDHGCASRQPYNSSGSDIWCWGSNAHGQLDFFEDQEPLPRVVPVKVGGTSMVEQLVATRTENLTRGAVVDLWGGHGEAELLGSSIGGAPGLHRSFELAVFDGHYCGVAYDVGIDCMRADRVVTRTAAPGAVAAAVGHAHVCVVSASGDVRCFGDAARGQLGDGSRTARPEAAIVPNVADAFAIASGADHTCVASGAGQVQCWGANDAGQLGDGTTVDRDLPVLVPGLSQVVALTAGYKHTCALRADGAVLCWGANDVGQLGDGTTATRLSPVAVVGLDTPG